MRLGLSMRRFGRSCVSPSSYTSRITLVQISFSPADLDSILRARSGSHQSPELLEDP
jgi:hypothetical protein